jgi:ABC-type transport system substrate-binding protein
LKYASLVRTALVAAIICTAVTACTHASTSSDAGGKRGVTIAQQWEPQSLNPALENGTSSIEWSMLVFSYLVKFDDRGRLIPDVATEIPTTHNGGISADGKTIVYHIRSGVRFADGTPLTAADCAWTIEAINNPDNNVQSRFAYDDVASATAPNATTLVLRLKHPFPPLLVVVGAPQGFPILPKHALANVADFNHADFNSAPFGWCAGCTATASSSMRIPITGRDRRRLPTSPSSSSRILRRRSTFCRRTRLTVISTRKTTRTILSY